ncbi:MAG: hypothetical protein HYY59_07930, partial [Candidatus Omnitrophica bacterium]|nr:hypothetical protein [Candidatus Omnitrophota bacterium]
MTRPRLLTLALLAIGSATPLVFAEAQPHAPHETPTLEGVAGSEAGPRSALPDSHAPQLTPPTLPIQGVQVDQPLTFSVRAIDPEGESLTLSTVIVRRDTRPGTASAPPQPLPAGARFTSVASGPGQVTGLFTWTPTAAQVGLHEFTILASDGALAGETTALLLVSEAAPAPEDPATLREAQQVALVDSPGDSAIQFTAAPGTAQAPGRSLLLEHPAGSPQGLLERSARSEPPPRVLTEPPAVTSSSREPACPLSPPSSTPPREMRFGSGIQQMTVSTEGTPRSLPGPTQTRTVSETSVGSNASTPPTPATPPTPPPSVTGGASDETVPSAPGSAMPDTLLPLANQQQNEPPPPPESVTPPPGRITITSDPSEAEIWYSLDEGKTWIDSGRLTPLIDLPVQPGEVWIKLRRRGYHVWQSTQTVSPGKPITIEADLSSPVSPFTIIRNPLSGYVGEQKAAVLMVKFRNDTRDPPYTERQVREAVFGSNGLGGFIHEVSYGKAWLAGDVFGWYTMDLDATQAVCRFSVVENAAIAAADAVVNFEGVKHLILVLASDPCDPKKSRPLNTGIPKQTLVTHEGAINASVTFISATGRTDLTPFYILIHEFGHSLELGHASYWHCGDAAVLGTQCESREYGDLYDVMGFGDREHYNAASKQLLGWLGPDETLEVTTSGTYELYPLEAAGPYVKLLTVPGYDPYYRMPMRYYLEYRQPIGFDTLMRLEYVTERLANVFQGVLFHIPNEGGFFSSGRFRYKPYETQLLDMNPEPNLRIDQRFANAALEIGQTYTDPSTSTSIHVVGKRGSRLTDPLVVQVTMLPDATPPFISNVHVSAITSRSATVSWRTDEPADSQVECGLPGYVPSRFPPVRERNPAMVTDHSIVLRGLVPSTYYNTCQIRSRNQAHLETSHGVGFITLSPSDTVPPPVVITSPTAIITSPVDGTTVSGTVTVKGEAHDHVAVSKIEVFADETRVDEFMFPQGTESASVRFTTRWNAPARADPYTLRARVVGPSENMAESSPVHVTVSRPFLPILESVEPATLTRGESTTLTFTGANFGSGDVLVFDGPIHFEATPTFVEPPTRLRWTFTPTEAYPPGFYHVNVRTRDGQLWPEGRRPIRVVTWYPRIERVDPTSLTLGNTETLIVTGEHFQQGAVLVVERPSRDDTPNQVHVVPPTFISSDGTTLQLTWTLPADQALSGSYEVHVRNPDDQISRFVQIWVAEPTPTTPTPPTPPSAPQPPQQPAPPNSGSPAPRLDGVFSRSLILNGRPQTLTVEGEHFQQGTMLVFRREGSTTEHEVQATSVSQDGRSLEVQWTPPVDFNLVGKYIVYVKNPPPAHQRSVQESFVLLVRPRHLVWGRVIRSDGTPLGRVNVQLNESFPQNLVPIPSLFSLPQGATTDADSGHYGFVDVPEGGSYDIIPRLEGVTFNPPMQTIVLADADARVPDFIATPPPLAPTPVLQPFPPTTITADILQTLTFLGTNFQPGAWLVYRPTAGRAPTVIQEGIQVAATGTSLTFTWTPPLAAVGTYDVAVRNPDGQVSLPPYAQVTVAAPAPPPDLTASVALTA